MKTRVVGQAGRYSASQGRSNARRALGDTVVSWFAFLAAAPFAVVAALGLVDGSGWGAPFLLAAIALAVVGFSYSRSAAVASTQSGRQQRGTQAEQEVVDALRKARVSLVINGAELNAGGDADHVVAHLRKHGRGVLAVVETKAGGGHVRMEGRRLLSGKNGRAIPGDPISQVERQAAALSRICGRTAVSVVCVPWMTNEPFWVGRTVVAGTRDLARLFAGGLADVALTEADVELIERNIHPKD